MIMMNKKIKRAQSIVGTSPGRPEHDFYPTPPEMTQALLDNYKFNHLVWEPACGDGAMSEVLLDHNYIVYSSDLINRNYGHGTVNFLETTGLPEHQDLSKKDGWRKYETIITNPPYKLAEKFVYHAFQLGCAQLALLCKLAFLEGQSRKRMFEKYPLAEVLVFSKRQTMTRNGEPSRNGGMIAFAWFIWDVDYYGKPTIGWI